MLRLAALLIFALAMGGAACYVLNLIIMLFKTAHYRAAK